MVPRASRNGAMECHACGSNLDPGSTLQHRPPFKSPPLAPHRAQSFRLLSVLLVVCDCSLLAVQPLLVYKSKVDGKFNFSPVGVNFLTEVTKVTLTIIILLFQHQRQKPGEKSIISPYAILKAARSNYLLAIPAFLYAINNYLKFIMQLYFNPSTVKMLSNLKVLVIALLMGMIMRRRFTVMQWEALGLLLIGITVNQLRETPIGASLGVQETHMAYFYTLIYVTIPSMASVYNEYALKSQYDTNIYLQNLFLYGYGAIFNFFAITVFEGGDRFNLFQGHSYTTLLLIINNAAQGILASFFFKYADTILKKYSSTVATIFTGLASAALFGHTLTINFVLGVSIVIISMHQFFSSSKPKDGHHQDSRLLDNQTNSGYTFFVNFVDMQSFGFFVQVVASCCASGLYLERGIDLSWMVYFYVVLTIPISLCFSLNSSTKELPLSTFIRIGDKASYKADSGSETEPLLPI